MLGQLSELSVDQELLPFVARHFQPLLLEILERSSKRLIPQSQSSLHERFSYILSCLLQQIPHIKHLAIRYFKTSPPFFLGLKEDLYDSDRLSVIVRTGSNLLDFEFDTFSKLWEWSLFLKLVQHGNVEVRWHAVHIIAMTTKMTDQRKLALIEKLFTVEERNSLHVRTSVNTGIFDGDLNGNKFSQPDGQMELSDGCPAGTSFSEEDLIGSYAAVCGVMLPRQVGSTSIVDKSLVMVPSTHQNLHSLALSVASESGVLLEGPIGSGKTVLVEYLAMATGRTGATDLLKVQLGDQTDSKVNQSV